MILFSAHDGLEIDLLSFYRPKRILTYPHRVYKAFVLLFTIYFSEGRWPCASLFDLMMMT